MNQRTAKRIKKMVREQVKLYGGHEPTLYARAKRNYLAGKRRGEQPAIVATLALE